MSTVNFWIDGKNEDCNYVGDYSDTFEFTFGSSRTKLFITISEKKITIDKPTGKLYNKAVQDAWRKAVLIYRMKYNNDLNCDEINIEVQDGDGVTPADIKEWIGKTLLEQGFDSSLGSNWMDNDFLNIITHNTKSDVLNNPAFASMYNYLASKTKKYDMDRFLYLWIALNGYYNALTWISLGKKTDELFSIKEAAENERFVLSDEIIEMLTKGMKPEDAKTKKEEYNTKFKKIVDMWKKGGYKENAYKPKSNFKLGELMDTFFAGSFGDYPRLSFLENVTAYNSDLSINNPLFFASQRKREVYFDGSLSLDEKSYEAFSTQIKNLSRDIKHTRPDWKSSDVWEIVYDFSLYMMKKNKIMEWSFDENEKNKVSDLLNLFDKYPYAFKFLAVEAADVTEDLKSDCLEIIDDLPGASSNTKKEVRDTMNAYFDNTQSDNTKFVNNIHNCLNELHVCFLDFLNEKNRAADFDGDLISTGEAYFLLFFFRNIAILKMDSVVEAQDFPLYIMFLFEYPYHWRNQLFHAKRTPALFSIPDDAEIETYDMLSYFLDRYLGKNIPILIKNIFCEPDQNPEEEFQELADLFLKVMMNMEYHNCTDAVKYNPKNIVIQFLNKIK